MCALGVDATVELTRAYKRGLKLDEDVAVWTDCGGR
jgi:hypothetical protein